MNPNDFDRKGHVRDYKSVLGSHGELKPEREPNPWTLPVQIDPKLSVELADKPRIKLFRYIEKNRITVQALFREINKNRNQQMTDSVLSLDEFALFNYEMIGIPIEESQALFLELDANNSGAIEYNEWAADIGPKLTHWRRRKKAISAGLLIDPRCSQRATDGLESPIPPFAFSASAPDTAAEEEEEEE